ncbi:uncharacterized protein BO80DRAFT_466950 [Aspergillus ibericus CBS 121593]|uniref:Uncharacterized protein n=1 Tax=Aspergillus ibericus CBS 121593 TaxID=1448316 RepID=A0A395GSV1_9EURO|nr:hypothetical protein BO80DRAFT_466950 [Aspergillus ibericus CBS 121593]RAK98519.1 hypothetical protein BO80DRAFT_466950 [Aspergillus ibericus CBS 121593]
MAPRPPGILLLCLTHEDSLKDTYAPLLKRLDELAPLQRAKTVEEAIRWLEAKPMAVIVTDGGVTLPANRPALEKLRSYVRGGGLAIFGLLFPSLTPLNRFNGFFRRNFNLPWESGDNNRCDFDYNDMCYLPTGTVSDSLPRSYSMKALQIKDARSYEKIFISVRDFVTDTLSSPGELIDRAQAAVVGGRMGHGYVVYLGDVNQEKESDEVILTLCDR